MTYNPELNALHTDEDFEIFCRAINRGTQGKPVNSLRADRSDAKVMRLMAQQRDTFALKRRLFIATGEQP